MEGNTNKIKRIEIKATTTLLKDTRLKKSHIFIIVSYLRFLINTMKEEDEWNDRIGYEERIGSNYYILILLIIETLLCREYLPYASEVTSPLEVSFGLVGGEIFFVYKYNLENDISSNLPAGIPCYNTSLICTSWAIQEIREREGRRSLSRLIKNLMGAL